MQAMTLVKPKRFTDLAATDLMARQCFRQDGELKVYFEPGAIRDMILYFRMLERSMRDVAAGTWSPLCWDKRGCWLTPEAKAFWHVLRNVDRAREDLCEGRRLNPWLKVGLHLARKWTTRLRAFSRPDGLPCVHEEYPRRMVAHICRVARRICSSHAFQNEVRKSERRAIDNYASCCEYVLSILRVHARPLVLRIDLYFEGLAKDISESPEAEQAFNKFMRNLSGGKIVPDVVGYIAKREDGLDRRVHFHVMCLLDGNEHRQAYNLTEQLGQFWVDDCVGSPVLASYKNCYERKDEYRFNCLGLLHYADDRMLMGMREALEYMCKEEAHILIKDEKRKNLRKGQPPEPPRDGSRRGAPRKRGNDLSVAELIFFTEGRQ